MEKVAGDGEIVAPYPSGQCGNYAARCAISIGNSFEPKMIQHARLDQFRVECK
jgi:hypothetical protein